MEVLPENKRQYFLYESDIVLHHHHGWKFPLMATSYGLRAVRLYISRNKNIPFIANASL